MTQPGAPAHAIVGAVELDGRRFTAQCRVAWDGIEYIGRIWFIEDADGTEYPDRSALPGRTHDDAISMARRLTREELERRLGRAQAEKRRFLPLRAATDEILAKVKYVNQVAVSARSGMLDPQGAASEMDLTERQLHELIRTLRGRAGVGG